MYRYGPVNALSATTLSSQIDALSGHRIDPMPTSTDQQKGPTCGLYALSFVLRYWYDQRAREGKPLSSEPLKARKADAGTPKDPTRVKDPSKPASLREIAKGLTTPKGKPITYLGEIFSCDAMVEVAKKAGFNATVHKVKNDDYIAKVYELLDKGIPPIVGVDVDANAAVPGGHGVTLANANHACPGKFGGSNAHWITLVGYATYGTVGQLLFQMNWGAYYGFLASSLKESTGQLLKFAKPEFQVWEKEIPASGPPPTNRGNLWTYQVQQSTRDCLRLSSSTWDSSFNRSIPLEHGMRFETSNKTGKTLTTVFPDVLLDLSNQVVEVTPA